MTSLALILLTHHSSVRPHIHAMRLMAYSSTKGQSVFVYIFMVGSTLDLLGKQNEGDVKVCQLHPQAPKACLISTGSSVFCCCPVSWAIQAALTKHHKTRWPQIYFSQFRRLGSHSQRWHSAHSQRWIPLSQFPHEGEVGGYCQQVPQRNLFDVQSAPCR